MKLVPPFLGRLWLCLASRPSFPSLQPSVSWGLVHWTAVRGRAERNRPRAVNAPAEVQADLAAAAVLRLESTAAQAAAAAAVAAVRPANSQVRAAAPSGCASHGCRSAQVDAPAQTENLSEGQISLSAWTMLL